MSEIINVLLVEDNLAEARLLQAQLADSTLSQFIVVHADRLSTALEQLKNNAFDVILLDLSLPDCSGLETLRAFHRHTQQIPIVVLTGLEDEQLAATAIKEGAQDYLTKQFSDTRLIDRAIRYAIQRKRFEEERVKLMQEHAARLKAEEANAMKLKFLAIITHELRTPLSSIKGFASTLLAEDVEWDAETQRQFLSIIELEADKLSDLVEQLLDLARLQAGTLRVDPQVETFDAIFKTALGQLKILTAKHRFEAYIPANLPPIIADPLRIAQVLSNLVGNAARYSPEQTCIQVHVQQIDQSIQVNVSDQGKGIPVEMRPAVFEAFRQIEHNEAGKKGVGLGLAICKGVVEKHNGQIWIHDAEPHGTVVSFTLPLAQVSG